VTATCSIREETGERKCSRGCVLHCRAVLWAAAAIIIINPRQQAEQPPNEADARPVMRVANLTACRCGVRANS
jgi:hypothetical protein